MNREVIDCWCERGILALVLAVLVMGPLAMGAVHEVWFSAIEGMAALALVLWLARLWLQKEPRLLWPPICWAVIAFALYALARYLTSDIEYVARQEVLRVLVYGAFFFVILNNLRRTESAQIVSLTLVLLAACISMYALYQFLTGSERVWFYTKSQVHRASGTFLSANNLGGFLELVLPLAVAYTFLGRQKAVSKVFLGYAALAILAAIGATISRGSWFSAALAMLVLFGVLLFFRGYRLAAAVSLALLVGGTMSIIPRSTSLQLRLKQLVNYQGQVDDDLRFSLWRPALRIWQQNIWWGVGPAHFDYRFREFRPQHVQRRPDRAHNDYLNTLADWGIAGTVIVASAWTLLGLGVARTWRLIRGSGEMIGRRSSNKLAFVLGGSIGLLALLLHSLVDFNMHVPSNALTAVALMALLSGHTRFATERYWVKPSLWTRIAMAGVLLAGAAYIGAQGWRLAREAAWKSRAEEAPIYSTEQVDFLKRAFAVESRNAETAYALGDALRVQGLAGDENYQGLTLTAMEWFDRASKLDPWNGYNYLRLGMCLDWLGRKTESGPCFSRAEALDPNGYYTIANIGLHYVALGDYAAARSWFERSLRLQAADNLVARNYLRISEERLSQAAQEQSAAGKQSLPRAGRPTESDPNGVLGQ